MALIDVNGKRFKNFMTKLYGLGAAVVIMGALFKILHLKGADLMLIIGLTTEAVIFAISAFEAQPKDYDWALVYPELENEPATEKKARKGSSGTVTQELDRMLEEAKIGPELLESLSAGMRKLSETAASLNTATDAAGATAAYSQQLGAAAKNMEALNALYAVQLENTTSQVDIQNTVMEKLSASAQNTEALAGEVTKLSQNLSQLNSVYGNMLAAMNVRS
ncbi:MAG: gliding motility protein GldL [Cryomorphaceae bacterium]|jgi:gliding motility-associated protein GldL|nr:gliding motility protein GldL [Cryomorphaceae bacterium]